MPHEWDGKRRSAWLRFQREGRLKEAFAVATLTRRYDHLMPTSLCRKTPLAGDAPGDQILPHVFVRKRLGRLNGIARPALKSQSKGCLSSLASFSGDCPYLSDLALRSAINWGWKFRTRNDEEAEHAVSDGGPTGCWTR